jgi:hypothetical protein
VLWSYFPGYNSGEQWPGSCNGSTPLWSLMVLGSQWGGVRWYQGGVTWSWDRVRWSRECVCVCLGSFYMKQGTNNKKKIQIKWIGPRYVTDMSQIGPRYVPDMFKICQSSQMFQARTTVCRCLTSFKVKLQVYHYYIGYGSYITVNKFIWTKSWLQPKYHKWARVSKVLGINS